jgi:type-F conjugative transfer system pilin assembly protein TrbC
MPFYKQILLSMLVFFSISIVAQESVEKSENQKNIDLVEGSKTNKQQFITKQNIEFSNSISQPITKEAKQDAINVINSVDSAKVKEALVVISDEEKQNVIWKELAKTAEPIIPQISTKNNAAKYGDIDAYIMISYSMPDTSIERLFTEASYQFPHKKIVFLLRGWDAPDLASLMAKVNKSIEGIDNPPSIAVDPTFFRKLEITEVPYFALKNSKNEWRKVMGDVSINQAFEESDSHYDTFKPVGRTYLIKEPDLLSYIENKIDNYDWDADLDKAKKSILKDRFETGLDVATKDYEYFVDPSITFKKPLMHDNEVIVSPGTQVNPLDHIMLSKKYAFIDVNSPEQLDIARIWKQKYKNVKFTSTKVAISEDELEALTDEFGIISELDPLLVKRFNLKEIPSLVEQVGKVLKVSVLTPFQKENDNEDL